MGNPGKVAAYKTQSYCQEIQIAEVNSLDQWLGTCPCDIFSVRIFTQTKLLTF